MNVIENIQGSGGKGGGEYRAPVEAPNTLQSQQEVTIVEAVSEGPIVGLVNADQSIAFNYTPLRTAGGALTYNGITWGNKIGGPDQEAFPDIAGAEAETSVNVEITKFFPRAVGPDSGAVVRQLSNTNCTHVRITLAVQGLYKQVLDDEERAGDTVGQTLSYSIVIKNVLGEVIVTYVGNRTDKTMSTAQWAHKFKLDGQGPWFVTITKLYDDNEKNNIKNDIYWSSFTEIVGYSMIYPHTAVMLVRGSAETFGSSVPSRQYNIKGLVVEVPSNYTVATRTYAGIWDGTFVNAWTDNPAWVLRDVIENDRYGLKKYFAAAVQNVELCDKWTLYEIAKVCDELVPDGYGGTEPRYTFNGQIMGTGEAKEVIQAIASIFHGMTYWGSGKLFAVSDFPTDPIRTLNQTQVIEGRLTYSTGSAQELHSVALVTWYDPNDYGRSRLEVVFSWDMFDKVGYRAVQVTAYGCTSRGQAYRQGLWTLLTEEEQWQCSCETGLDTYDLMPGNVIQVADPTMMGIRFSGRYVTISETTITLDAPVILAAGETYTLRLIADDGTEESRVITSRGTSAVITVEEAFTKTFVEHAAWSIAGSDAAPKTFAVRSIKEQETGRLMLSLREVLADKYDRLESSITFTATPGASTLTDVIAAPTGLIVTPTTYITDGGSLMQRLSFSWATVMDIQLSTYEVQYLSPAGDWTILTGLSTNNVDVTNAILGVWTFKVRAIAVDGRSSAWATATHTLTGSTTIPMAPTNLTATGWFGDIILTWQIPDDAMYYYSEIYECSTDDLESAVYAARSYGNQFTSHVGSWTGMYYWVRCIGKNGVASDWSADSGTYGRSEQDSHNDFVDLMLRENPYLTGVQTDLNTAIALVDTNINTVQTDLNTAIALVDTNINTVQTDLSTAIALVDTNINTVQTDLNTAIALVDTTIKTVDLPAYEQRIANRIDEVNDGIMTQVNTYADGTIDAMLGASEAISTIRDAGIITDPLTGTTSIFALDAYKTANDARVSNVEIDLNAVESTLVSKVTLAQVDERIAGAVFGDPTELLLSGMDARIVVVEEGLDAVEGTLTEKASVVEVDALGGRIGTAESRLDGQDAEIALLATSQELDAVESRVSIAEVNIDALEGSITQTVASSVTATQDKEELIAQGLVDAMLNDREAQADTKAKTESALAMAESELYAHINDEMEAEAGQRLLLAAKVDNNLSAIQTEATARATADEAITSKVETLMATVGGNTAAIQSEATARSDADSALASQITTLQGTVGDNTSAIQTEATARANADSAMASNITTLQASVSGNTSGIQAEATTRANADDALASSVETLQTTVGSNTAAIQSEATARSDADSALASQITTLASTVGDNTAAIQTEQTTRANADSALASQITTLVSSVSGNTSGIQAEAIAQGLVDAMLNDREAQADTKAKTESALAMAESELYAHINDEMEAEAGQRLLLAAKVDNNLSAIQTEATVRSSADSAMASQITTLSTTVGNHTSAIQSEATARADADDALSSTISTVLATANAKNKTYRQVSAPTSGMTAGDLWFDSDANNKAYRYSGSSWVATDDTRIATNTAAIETERTARANADSAMASQITTLQGTVGDNTSAIQTEATARANADSALASSVSTLQTTVGNNTSAIQTEATARANADSAMASQITTLQSTVAGNTAAIQTEAQTRSDADGALSSTISTVAATANAKNKTYRQTSAPTTGMTAGDLWFDSDDNNKAYRYNGSTWVATDDTRIAANTAAIQTEQTARADADEALASSVETLTAVVGENIVVIQSEATARSDADSALASQITTLQGTVGDNTSAIQSEATARANADSAIASSVETLQTTVGNNTSAIQTIDSSVDGIKSKHAVKIDTNGYVTGYELIGTGASSAMVFHVDNFLIGKPGASNDYPFALGVVDGVTRISMQNVFIQDASIKTLKIENNAVTTYVFVTGGQTSSWRTYYGAGTPTWRDLPANNSVIVTGAVADRPAMITFSVNWYSAEDYGGTSFRVLAHTAPTTSGATVIWSKNVSGGDQINMSYTEQFQWIPPASGTWYLYIQWLLGSGGDWDCKWNTYIRSHSLSLFHMKR